MKIAEKGRHGQDLLLPENEGRAVCCFDRVCALIVDACQALRLTKYRRITAAPARDNRSDGSSG